MDLFCKKCNKKFLNKIEIDGEIKYCNHRKLCFDCSPYATGQKNSNSFYHQWRRENQTNAWCCGCKQQLPIENFYLRRSGNNRPQSLCKICNNKRSKERSSSFKKWAVDYKGGKCIKCMYDKCLDAFDFHHRNPEEKDIDVAKIKLWSKERAIKELDKCDLVCRNCHAEIHYEIRNK